jgi:hypothetical protein
MSPLWWNFSHAYGIWVAWVSLQSLVKISSISSGSISPFPSCNQCVLLNFCFRSCISIVVKAHSHEERQFKSHAFCKIYFMFFGIVLPITVVTDFMRAIIQNVKLLATLKGIVTRKFGNLYLVSLEKAFKFLHVLFEFFFQSYRRFRVEFSNIRHSAVIFCLFEINT